MKSNNIPNAANITKDLRAGKAEEELTIKATKSVNEVMNIETPANFRVLPILLDTVNLGLT